MTCSTQRWQRPARWWLSPTPSTGRSLTGSPSFLGAESTSDEYEGARQAFVTTLDAHAEEAERDLFPPPVEITEPELEELGNRMLTRMEGLRAARLAQLRVTAMATVLRTL